MSDHSSALVPAETWSYASPELRVHGKIIDIGLICEALIYYDTIHLNFTSPEQLSAFIQWLINQQKLEDFLALVSNGEVRIYEYSFMTTAIRDLEGTVSIWNIQDPIQEKPETFEQRFLYHPALEKIIPKARHRQKIYDAFRGKVLEVKASEFGAAAENARADIINPRRNEIIVQSFVDEVYRFKSLGTPPAVTATVTENKDKKGHDVRFNIDLATLGAKAGEELNFNPATPITAVAHANRYIWSAANLNCDLYLGTPMSNLVGDKLYESATHIAKTSNLIDQLQKEVEFPDIRVLINNGTLKFTDILSIRKKATKFREWLQQEGPRDRNAIYAYHTEVAAEAGLTTTSRKLLRLFGPILGGAAAGAISGPVAGAVTGAGVYLIDVASRIGEGWKPIVFGEWLRERIAKVLAKQP